MEDEMKKYILVAGAWPYANGSLHIGHVAGLLPGDVLARYHRAKGDRVCYVSGSDCHGTPVAIRAKRENCSPQEISDRYHEGILIGYVNEIEMDSNNLTKSGTITPAVDFEHLHTVLVITDLKQAVE